MLSTEPRQLLRTEDMATVLGVTRQTVHVRLKRGTLPGYLIGGIWMGFRDEILERNTGADHIGKLLDGWPEPLTLMELAQLLNTGPQTTNRWLREGVIAANRPGKQWLIFRAQMRAAFDAGRNTPPASTQPAAAQMSEPEPEQETPPTKPWLAKTLRELGLD